ncbi:family 43 glycosylhydrolase [Deinococcus antarcticus]|uniref:Family 43 glycosylhydrolase n=1 Tax=Deinococcus antarcticus TaxID=1298767 RepID=A0ABV8A596_9DEIO
MGLAFQLKTGGEPSSPVRFVRFSGGTPPLFYSGGAWTNETYGVGHAVAPHPLGPWREPQEGPVVLRTQPGELRGPGHNSVVQDEEGRHHIVFHAWNAGATKRQLHVAPLDWPDGRPGLAQHPFEAAK